MICSIMEQTATENLTCNTHTKVNALILMFEKSINKSGGGGAV